MTHLTDLQSFTVPAAAQALIDQGALVAAGNSAGKDSAALLIYLRRVVPASQLVIVHADLGQFEHDGVLTAIEEVAGDIPLLVARATFGKNEANGFGASPKTFLNLVRRRHAANLAKGKNVSPWPDTNARECTSDLKTGPIWVALKHYAKANGFGNTIINCRGIRGDESASRAKKLSKRGSLYLEKGQCGAKRKSDGLTPWNAWNWDAIHDWTCTTDRGGEGYKPGATYEVFEIIRAAGEVPHPAYGYDYDAKIARGNQRLSCKFCVFGSQGDLRNGYAADPELFEEISALEKETGWTFFNGQTLAERTNIITTDKAA